jgi:hypothetical protein
MLSSFAEYTKPQIRSLECTAIRNAVYMGGCVRARFYRAARVVFRGLVRMSTAGRDYWAPISKCVRGLLALPVSSQGVTPQPCCWHQLKRACNVDAFPRVTFSCIVCAANSACVAMQLFMLANVQQVLLFISTTNRRFRL